MKVDKKKIYLDEEDEIIALTIAKQVMEYNFELPKWCYLQSEWNTYVMKKVEIENRLRKLKEKMGYDTPAVD